ncbi:MAG: aldehyde dehydrogenase family protein [Elusimicrobia bacterium]|nr:aldehyde dehydrogenase family protein [Elusimicrobiota bacterium]
MEQFSLFVDGKDVDTGKYEYFPYADQTILDFKKTYQIISKLKKGERPEEVDKYIYAKYCVGDNELNKRAIESAYKASKIMRDMPVAKRRKILYDVYNNLVANMDEFIKLFAIEGHPCKLAGWEYLGLEQVFCKETMDRFKDELWDEVGKQGNERIYLVRKADGVVVVCPPKNAAASNSLIAAFALLSGNALIIKPPLKAPVATIQLWKKVVIKALRDNNAPESAVNIVVGNSKVFMDEWMNNPKVNDIFFFGDSEQGLEIGKKACEHNKKAILELSGNDNLFVWEGSNIEGAVDSAMDAYLGSTQICMVPKTLIVHEDAFNSFSELMIKKVNDLKFGLPSNMETCLTPVIKMSECIAALEDALSKGAKLLCGGNRVNYNGTVAENGIYFQPTLVEIDSDNPELFNIKIIKDENFFPVIPIIKIKSDLKDKQERDADIFEKMMNLAETNEYGLRASVWVKSAFYTRQFMKHVDKSGLLRINSKHIGVSLFLSSHGGIGKTGGPYGEMNYIWQKTSHLQGISLTRD